MSDTVQRIKEYIDLKDISIRKFEESVGFSNGAFSSQYKNKKAIGVDKVEKILQIYSDINPVWLLTGKGDMLYSKYGNIVDKDVSNYISEDNGTYELKNNHYRNLYVKELEREVELLRKDLKQKQDIIDGFLSGNIIRS